MPNLAIDLMERGYVPDWLTRIGIRRLLAQRLRAEATGDDQAREAALARLETELRASPIALHTQSANAQHYELPAGFFQKTLGPRLKYKIGENRSLFHACACTNRVVWHGQLEP